MQCLEESDGAWWLVTSYRLYARWLFVEPLGKKIPALKESVFLQCLSVFYSHMDSARILVS